MNDCDSATLEHKTTGFGTILTEGTGEYITKTGKYENLTVVLSALEGIKNDRYTPRRDAANRHPVNQVAKKFLKKAKVVVYPEELHALQLVEWGIQDRGVRIIDPANKRATEDLLEVIDLIRMTHKPKRAQRLLLQLAYRESLENQQSPDDAAAFLAERECKI